MTRRVAVTVTHLELPFATDLRPSPSAGDAVVLQRVEGVKAASVASAMYREVGAQWHWRDRLAWTEVEWAGAMNRDGAELWTLEDGSHTIGYFELGREDDVIEIKYFGLTARGLGRKLGGWLLTKAVERAWELGAARVVLTTCTLDSPAALPNYLARGFRPVRVEHQEREIPE